MSFKITIDNREVEVEPGQTVLAAARQLGIDIPTLCYLERCGPLTSCLVCVVRVKANGRVSVVPSCGLKAQPGMVIESETAEVHELRRTALELLLSDHVGDCLAPCHRICPLRLNIPVLLRHIEAGRSEDAIIFVRESLPLPAVTGRLCNHPCENGCRRGTWDRPMAIRDIERLVGNAARDSRYLPACKTSSGKSVAIVGSGPVGLGAAWQLARDGHACTVIDRHAEPGGSLRAKLEDKAFPGAALDGEIHHLRQLGIEFKLGVELGRDVTIEGLKLGFDAVLLAPGERAKDQIASLAPPPGAGNSPREASAADGMRRGSKIDPQTGQTILPYVFAAGSVIKPIPHVARALAEGMAVATRIDQFLHGQKIGRAEKVFSSMMGRLEKDEVKLFVRGTTVADGAKSLCPACGTVEASTEAGRCLHCDCRAAGQCKLQHYAQAYDADPTRFRQQRRRFEQHRQPAAVIFEPGKCIVCGICVNLAKQAAEPLGLTFVGRGFDVRVGAPMHREFADGLQKVAMDCVENCPTGAIVFDDLRPRAGEDER